MKNLLYFIIMILTLCFSTILYAEKKLPHGVTFIKNKFTITLSNSWVSKIIENNSSLQRNNSYSIPQEYIGKYIRVIGTYQLNNDMSNDKNNTFYVAYLSDYGFIFAIQEVINEEYKTFIQSFNVFYNSLKDHSINTNILSEYKEIDDYSMNIELIDNQRITMTIFPDIVLTNDETMGPFGIVFRGNPVKVKNKEKVIFGGFKFRSSSANIYRIYNEISNIQDITFWGVYKNGLIEIEYIKFNSKNYQGKIICLMEK